MRASRTPPTLRILSVLKRIPRGKVATYGQVARLAGLPRGARQVARILHSLSLKEKLPWHRVLNVRGRISLPMQGDGTSGESPGALQQRLLRAEGVRFDGNGCVDLAGFGWKPRSASASPDG